MPLLHRSITGLREQELVAHVLNDVHYRDTLFNIKGMFTKGARILEEVPLHRLRKTLAGDIDILVIPGGQPELSTAIQVKRFEAIVYMNAEGLDVVDGGAPVLAPPLEERGLAHPVLSQEVLNRNPTLGILQDSNDLALTEPRLSHDRS